ncbi:unnamed protein product [Rhodiola kirilowii]
MSTGDSETVVVSLQQVMKNNQRELSIKRMEDGIDRFSDLPDSLKERILECLPIKDAVRASILSSEWRYIWTFRKRLDFGEAFVRLVGKYTREKYTRIIDRILHMHRGPIEHVSLCIPLQHGYWNDKTDLNAWLLTWSRKGILELEIDSFFCYKLLIFHLPSSLFQFQSLMSLKLTSCALNPPPDFCGFCNLVTLHLWSVRVSSDSLGTFISRCRQLENLYIKYCNFYCRADPLIINAPNMRTLEFWESGAIVFEDVPRLSEVSLCHSLTTLLRMPVHCSKMCSSFKLPLWLPKIEKLDCDVCLLEHLNGDCPHNLPILLFNLKTLRLNFLRIHKREDIAFIFCLLRSAPSLQSLHIKIYQESLHSPKALADCLENLVMEGRKANEFNELVTINIGLFNNLLTDVYELTLFKFIEILLSSCPLLKTLYVAPNWRNERDAVKLARLLNWLRKGIQKLEVNQELPVKRMKDGVDRLSDLPDSLKERILECLPIKDAVRTRIQKLEIDVFNDQALIFHLPFSLFQFQSLTSLKLTSCALKPPPGFSGFCNLVTLHLRNVMLLYDSLGTFISRCRQLENLYIKYCNFYCLADPLIINAPNMKTMEFWGCTSGAIDFENVPRLSEVSLRHSLFMQLRMPVHHSRMCNQFNLLCSLRKIEKLDCDICLLEHLDGDCPDNLPMLLINLKTLRLNFLRICNRKDIAFIFCLLRSAPSLQTLHIEVFQAVEFNKGNEDQIW